MLLVFHYLLCLKFSLKLITFSKSYARKQLLADTKHHAESLR